MRAGRAVVLGPTHEEARTRPPRGSRPSGRAAYRGSRRSERPCGAGRSRHLHHPGLYLEAPAPPRAARTNATTCSWPPASLEEARAAGLRPRPVAHGQGPLARALAGAAAASSRPPSPAPRRRPQPRGGARAGRAPADPRPLRPALRRDGGQGRPRPRAGALPPRPRGGADSPARGSRRHPRRHRRPRRGPRASASTASRTCSKALARARRLCRPGDTVVVAGSLYLVGEVLSLRSPRKWSRASGRSHSATPR